VLVAEAVFDDELLMDGSTDDDSVVLAERDVLREADGVQLEDAPTVGDDVAVDVADDELVTLLLELPVVVVDGVAVPVLLDDAVLVAVVDNDDDSVWVAVGDRVGANDGVREPVDVAVAVTDGAT